MLTSKGKETLKCLKSMSGQVRGEYEPQRYWLEALQVCVVFITYDLFKFLNHVRVLLFVRTVYLLCFKFKSYRIWRYLTLLLACIKT